MKRRDFIKSAGLTALALTASSQFAYTLEEKQMYGIIGKMIAAPERRDALIEILISGTRDMPGCLQYVVSKDGEDQNAIWITEIWKDEESHKSSLSLSSVQEAIAKGRPLIAGFSERHVIEPIGGQGI